MVSLPAAAEPVVAVQQEPEPLRLSSLDSLRGLAALTVMCCHVLWLCKPDTALRAFYQSGMETTRSVDGWMQWVRQLPLAFFIESTPLHLFVAGHEAVILFYLLSGFVLYVGYERRRVSTYRSFITRRVCRLYLPYLVSLGVAVGLNATVSTGGLAAMNDWFNHTWHLPVNRSQVLQHVSLVGSFDTDLFLMPCWTLVHEMRISIIFPLLAIPVVRANGWLPAILVALSAAGIALDAALGSYGNYFITLHYSAFFLVGAIMARERRWCTNVYSRLSLPRRVAFLSVALTLYVFGRTVSVLTPLPTAVADLPIAAGAALIMLWSMSNPRMLLLAPVRWLGKVSYGLYLLHLSLFLAAIHLLHGILPLWVILLIAVPLSFVATALFWRFVERPAMRLGRRLTSSMPPRAVDLRVASSSSLPPLRESSW